LRFLHTSDLHLGKRLGEISLMDDQRYILQRIADIAVQEGCSAVVVAGDLYQQSAPSAEAMELLSWFFSELHSRGIKVVAVAGNHDSGQRVAYFSGLVRESGIYISERFGGELQHEVLTEGGQTVNFWLLPFIRPSDVRRFCPETEINSYTDAVKAVIDSAGIDWNELNVIVAHQFITGSAVSDSEEISVGGLDNVDAAVFEGFDYTALGHLHRPQKAGSSSVIYSGSPLKYSVSEAGDVKECVIVDIKGKGQTEQKHVPLTGMRDVREVKGFISEIMQMPYSEDYVRVEIHDEDVPPDARISVSTVFPNMIRYAVYNSKTSEETDVDIAGQVENRSPLELFEDFYTAQNNGVGPDEKRMDVMRAVFEEAEGEEQ